MAEAHQVAAVYDELRVELITILKCRFAEISGANVRAQSSRSDKLSKSVVDILVAISPKKDADTFATIVIDTESIARGVFATAPRPRDNLLVHPHGNRS